ncbi:hypothetical protein PENTCL1PPCAC_21792, partial [Pristionchus entomophagus]
ASGMSSIKKDIAEYEETDEGMEQVDRATLVPTMADVWSREELPGGKETMPESASAVLAFVAAQAAAVFLQITGAAITNSTPKVTFEFSNFTNEVAKMKGAATISGSLEPGPLDVAPAEKMKFHGHRTIPGFYGAEGSIGFEIDNRVVCVYYCVPFTFAGGHNALAVAIGPKGVTKDKLYSASDVEKSGFFKKIFKDQWSWRYYSDELKYVEIEDDEYAVRGMMGSKYHTNIQIDIVPKDKTKFADKLKKKMEI